MLGTIVNSLAIIGGCLLGIIIKGRMNEKIATTVMNGVALSVLYIGIAGAIEGENAIIMIICIAVGALLGEIIDFDKRLVDLGDNIEKRFNKNNDNLSISKGFVSASLLFCVGAMAIVGSLQSGLSNNHEILFAKSVLDFISAIIFTATLGIGVIFSSVAVFLYQGTIAIGSVFLSGILSDLVINIMGATGSLIIIGLGLNMLDVTKIKVSNLLPGIFIPIILGVFGII